MMRVLSNILSVVGCCVPIALMMTFGLVMIGLGLMAFIVMTPFFLLEEKHRRVKQHILKRTC